MSYRKLRIALSTGCILIAVMLFCTSCDRQWRYDTSALYAPYQRDLEYADYYLYSRGGAFAALVAIMPMVPWPERFSLRTLLIAMTLVALVLGLIVWLLR